MIDAHDVYVVVVVVANEYSNFTYSQFFLTDLFYDMICSFGTDTTTTTTTPATTTPAVAVAVFHGGANGWRVDDCSSTRSVIVGVGVGV